MKVFITGTESFVGKEFIAQCDQKNIEVFGCDLAEPSDKRFERADICEKDIANIIPEGIDAIVHLAALSTDKQCRDNAYECFNVNVMGTLNLIDAAVHTNAKQFIFASSEWVYDDFSDDKAKDEDSFIDIANLTSEYALSKLVSEANLRQKYQHGLCPVTILRFGIIYGPREKGGSAVESLFNSVRTRDELTVGSLKTGRCFIHVSDIASGIIGSIGKGGFNIINLQGDGLVTLGQIVEVSQTVANRSIKIIEADANKASIRRLSNAKAKDILNWQPKLDLQSGITSLL